MLRIMAGLAALALPFSAMAQEKVLEGGDARRRARHRSDLDDADHRQHPRRAGLRHAVRQRRQPEAAAADGRQVRDQPRPADLHLHPARRAEVPRRLAGHDQGRHRLDQALGRQGRRRPAADGLRHRPRRGRRQDLQDGAARALRHGAGIARQDRQLDRRHHAREGCADRPAAAGQGIDRLRPLHLRQGAVGARQQGGVPQEQGLRAAARQRAAVVLRRQQDPRRRPHRADLDLRSADGDVGPGQRRDRFLREPQHRLPAAARQGARREADEDRHHRQHAGHDPAQSPASALQQREGAPGDVPPDQPGGLPARHRRRSRSTTASATAC